MIKCVCTHEWTLHKFERFGESSINTQCTVPGCECVQFRVLYPQRVRPAGTPHIPEKIPVNHFRNFYFNALRVFVTLRRAWIDSGKETEDKKKTAVTWVARILDLARIIFIHK